MALAKAGRAQEAAAEYREALALRPNWPEALNRLARLRATFADPRFRNGAESVALAAQACRLTRRANADYLDTLAAACAEAGRFADAVAVAEEARTLAASQGNKALAAAIDLRLALYRTGQPYHEAAAVPPQVNP
jgi:Flp pilus assembly protein TadD